MATKIRRLAQVVKEILPVLPKTLRKTTSELQLVTYADHLNAKELIDVDSTM